MAVKLDYRGLGLVVTPTGSGGIILTDNFSGLAERTGPVWESSVPPEATHDGDDTASIGQAFYQWSKWYDTDTETLYICTDNTTSAAIWSALPHVHAFNTDLTYDGDWNSDEIPIFAAPKDNQIQFVQFNVAAIGSGSITFNLEERVWNSGNYDGTSFFSSNQEAADSGDIFTTLNHDTLDAQSQLFFVTPTSDAESGDIDYVSIIGYYTIV